VDKIAEGGKSSTPLTNTQLSGLITPSTGQKGTLDYRMFFEHADKGRLSPWYALLSTPPPHRAITLPMYSIAMVGLTARGCQSASCQADGSVLLTTNILCMWSWAQARHPTEHIRLQRPDSVQLPVRDPQVDSRQVRGERTESGLSSHSPTATRTHCLPTRTAWVLTT